VSGTKFKKVPDTFVVQPMRHAELKPLSASGYRTFLGQVRRWREGGLKGKIGLFMYDTQGNIIFMGTW
jgi:hypothetical protein